MIRLKLDRARRASSQFTWLIRPHIRPIAAVCLSLAAVCVLPGLAQAQAIVATVNGTPITNIDIEQRMKLLKILRKPAGKDAALQSIIDDNVKLDETSKYKIKAGDADIGHAIQLTAANMKMAPEALMNAMHAAGIEQSHIKDHFASEFTFRALMTAYHKGVEASETEIRAELAKEGGKAAAGTDYTLRQVVFAIQLPLTLEKINSRTRDAEQLRARFTDCKNGVALARPLPDVAVKEEIRRNSRQLTEPVKELLDKTAIGHLTPPQRSSEGIEMIAVCNKAASNDDTAVRTTIAEKIIGAQIDAEIDKRLKELRAEAIIVKK